MDKKDKRGASVLETLRVAAEEGRRMRQQADHEERANRAAVDLEREREAERWLTEKAPGFFREAARRGLAEVDIGFDKSLAAACRAAGLNVRTSRNIMSGIDFNFVRLPEEPTTQTMETIPGAGPLARDAIAAIEHAHIGVWIDAGSRTRVYTSTSERGEAGLSVVFDVPPSIEQARVAADGLLALRRRLEEIERRR